MIETCHLINVVNFFSKLFQLCAAKKGVFLNFINKEICIDKKKQASHRDTSEHKWQYLINKRKYIYEKHFGEPNVFIVKNLNNINSLFKNIEDDKPKIIPKKLIIYVK